jgi:spermidine/putrescine transport system substrate-binding protein
VTWPVFAENKPITSGLAAERDATLQLYIWTAYINQACVNAFAKKYKCKVQITTFNTMDEAMSKLRSGLSFDLLIGATVDVLGQLIESRLVQPLNHSYIPNITQAWPDFTNPFYDQGWQYTVPYTIYTTGISWRKDLVDENPLAMSNPWAMPWQAKYKGRVAILDDYRESISLGLMKNGLFLQPQHHRLHPDRHRAQGARGPHPPGQRPHRQQRLHRGTRRRHLDPPCLVRGHGRGRVVHA